MPLLKRFPQQKEIFLLVASGLLSLFILDTILVQGFYKEERYRETLMAERLQAQVQSSLEEHVTALIALKVVYQNFTDINEYDFQQYGKSITATLNGFQRLFFIDPKLVVRQVYPISPENSGLYGYSLKKETLLTNALLQAKTTQNPTTSRLLPFLNHPKSFWAFIPIYRNNNKEFLGFAAGEISLERIWQPYIRSFSQYQLQLIDPDGTQLFQQVSIDLKRPTVTEIPFNIAGQSDWKLQLNPINPSSESLLIQRVSLWLGGILILLLGSTIILSAHRHKSELEEAQQQFKTIFEASPDGILMLDDKLHLQVVNPMVRTWLEQDEQNLTEQTFFDLFRCQCPNLEKCRELSYLLCTSERFSADLPEVLETQLIHHDQHITFRLNASRIYQEREGRKASGFICVLGDISTSKELERIKESYVATLTHDLRTPLLAQQMVLTSLESAVVGDEQKRLLSGARESVQDLLEMVNATLLFYKLESAHVTLHRQNHSVLSLLREVMANLQPLAEKKMMSLELNAALNLPEIWVDSIQLKRVFHNLISNAISYGHKDTPIHIAVQTQKALGCEQIDNLLIEIRNEGRGIAPEELPRIFDKYFSLSRKFKQIGTGLGLYIARRIVELHGGCIWATSEPGKQTSFFVSLPLTTQMESTQTIASAVVSGF
ncbi:MAG TPA: ATP-binding protein [Oculatellaceae cyanobacterium]